MLWKINSKLPTNLDPSARLSAIEDLLLTHRGLKSEVDRQQFLSDELSDPHQWINDISDLDFNQLKSAVSRIRQAIDSKQPIIIYGDYDCDGVCATAILWRALHSLHAKATPFIPNRFIHGYGLSEKGLNDALSSYKDNLPLIITVDNGIRAHSPADYLAKHQIDLIITDHHQPADTLPVATAIVHTISLCGAGVAWILASQLIADDSLLNELLGLAALATICDQLPLIGINRLLVKFGLHQLRTTTNPGLQALYSVSQIDSTQLDTYHLGFLIGPRINAAGRLGHALDALRLLCTSSPATASKYAISLNAQNLTRQELTQNYLKAALEHFNKLTTLPKLLFFPQHDCPEGILGLIAGKLTETFSRPSIVLSSGGDIIKGSARSIPGVNITDLLSRASHLLIDFGGHELAAGLTTSASQLSLLHDKLLELVHPLDDKLFSKTLDIELELLPSDINNQLLNLIQQFAPFGLGNPQPVLTSSFDQVDYRLVGADQRHLKLNLKSRGNTLNAIGFNLATHVNQLSSPPPFHFAFTVEANTYNGHTTLQLNIKDLKPGKIKRHEPSLPT